MVLLSYYILRVLDRVFVMQGTVIPKLNVVMSADPLQNGISLQILKTPSSLPTFNIVNIHLESSF